MGMQHYDATGQHGGEAYGTHSKGTDEGIILGQCTCGLVKRDAVPCEHMAVIVVSSRIGVLTGLNIMPFWWKRAQWQEHFPREVTAECYANMEVIRADYEADDTIHYCPAWRSAPNKSGRPAKGKRKLPALEIAQGMKRKPKYLTRFCQICRGFSHQTIDCWLQEKNKEHRPKAWKGQLAQEIIKAAEEAAVEEAMRISADPLPIGPGARRLAGV